MEYGIVLQTDPSAWSVVELMARAEELGFDYGWTFDSCVLWQEPFVIHSQILARTRRMRVGPMVTNPSTRDWTVTASTFATLNDMFGPRTVCGIGRGDSALRVTGGRPNTLGALERSMRVIKELAEGREAEIDGTSVRLPWVGSGALPVWAGAYGPKGLDLVGRLADGFVLQLAGPQLAKWMIDHVRSAARDAGRDPDSITMCAAAPAYVSDDVDHAREQCRWFGGMVGNHVADLVARYGGSGDAVPAELTDYVRAREGYDYAHHGRAGNPSSDFVPDEIVDRFCVLGPPQAHVDKLAGLRDVGVDQFALYAMHDAKESIVDDYGEKVIPAVPA